MRQVILSLATTGMLVLLVSGVALAAITCAGGYCEGTTGTDTMEGTPGGDQMYGLGDADTMNGRDGNDSMWGDWHQVVDAGEPGADTMNGGRGNDRLQGDEHPDTLKGGPGNDHIEAREGGSGGGGGESDTIDCGRGKKDTVFFDRGTDRVANCEIKNPPVG